LKKDVRSNIIKTILGYLPIVALEWKIVITSIRQEYESTEGRQDYRMWSGIIYGGRGVSMDIRKTKDKDNKNRKLKYQYLN